MRFISLALAALSAHLLPAQAYEFSTAKLCTTKYGLKSVSVKSTSYAVTIPITFSRKLTVTPTSTITPPPETATTTTTLTSTSAVITTPTETFTDTTSVTSTSFVTNVETTGTTTTATSTSSVATYTVPTPAGFTPIASGPGYVPKKRSLEMAAAPVPAIRGRSVEERAASRIQVCPEVGRPGSFSQYPQTVICGALVIAKTTSTRTYTATSTVSTTLPVVTNTITTTATTTETTTSAAAPASTTTTITLSFSTTRTATQTITTTATQTLTVIQGASTVYAACASSNVVNHANGNQGIFQAYYSGLTPPATNEVAISDPVACCEQCQKSAGCTGYAQFPGQPRCFYFTNGQCDGSQNFGQFFQSGAGFSPADGYTVGNGPCGQLRNGGSG